MKKTLLSLAFLAAGLCLYAQKTTYPDVNKSFLEMTDSQASLDYGKRPLIGIPSGYDGAADIVRLGGIPVTVCTEVADFGTMRDLASNLDGFVMTQSFCDLLDAAARKGGSSAEMMLTKALLDRNVPLMGSCWTVKTWNKGMMRQDSESQTLGELIAKASTYRHAKALMSSILTVDTHCDLPGRYRRGYSVGLRNQAQGSIPKLDEGCMSSMVIISYVGNEVVEKEGKAAAAAKAQNLIDKAYADVAAHSDYCGIARTSEEARALKAQGKMAYFIGVENGSALGGSLDKLRSYSDQGVIYMTLSHMYDNDICNSSSHTADGSKGLTDFGREVVREMNRLGMVIDCSHTSEGTFWDVYNLSKVPFVCSHSGAMAEWKHDRNLTDAQLKALAEKDGVVQVYIVQSYMSKDKTASVDTFMAHLNHCVEVAGIDHVGIGADFDGGGGGWGLNGANDHINVTVKMIEHGYSDEDIAKLWGGNFFRVLDAVQAAAEK